MRHTDPHDRRKWHIESEMIAGSNPPRIMNVNNYKTPEEQKLFEALARIAALEKELAEARKDKERINDLEEELARIQSVVGEKDYELIEKLLRPAAKTPRQQGSE